MTPGVALWFAILGGLIALLFAGIGLYRFPFLALAGFVLLNLADYRYVSFSVGLPGVTSRIYLSDLLLAATLLTWLIFRLSRRYAAGRAPLTIPVVAFVFLGCLGIVRGLFQDFAGAFGNGRFVFYALTYFCAFDATRLARTPDWILRLFVWVTTIVSSLGLLIFLALRPESLKVIGFPGKMSIYSLLASGLLAFGIVRWPAVRRNLGLLAQSGMIVVAGTRQTLFLVPLLVTVAARRLHRSLVVAILVAGLIAAGTATIQAIAKGEGISSPGAYSATVLNPLAEPTLRWRLDYWDALIDQASAGTLIWGVGIGNYFESLRLPAFPWVVSHSPHNCFLVLLVFGGLPLLGTYLATVAVAVQRYFRLARRSSEPQEYLAGFGLFAVLVCQFALGLNAEHRVAGIWPMMWILFGTVDGLLQRGAPGPPWSRARNKTKPNAGPATR